MKQYVDTSTTDALSILEDRALNTISKSATTTNHLDTIKLFKKYTRHGYILKNSVVNRISKELIISTKTVLKVYYKLVNNGVLIKNNKYIKWNGVF
jgi:hypothetical protein